MHSYVYIGGRYVGNGFALREEAMGEAALSSELRRAGARMECSRDCDALAPADERAQFESMLQQPLALLGWSGCECTNIARARFESAGACYVQRIWPTDTAPLYKYLQWQVPAALDPLYSALDPLYSALDPYSTRTRSLGQL